MIRQAAAQDYESFFASEIELRRLQQSPPFTELLAVTMAGLDETQVLKCASRVRAELLAASAGTPGSRVLGPAPLSILRVNNKYRYRVTLCAAPGSGLRREVADTIIRLSAERELRGVSIYADTNPMD